MKDIAKPFRIAVANALQGNISVNVYDEKRFVQSTDQRFVILSTQQQIPSNETDCTWTDRASIDIEVYEKTGSEVSKDGLDDVSNEILSILLPAPYVTGLTSSNLQFVSAYCESILSRNMAITDTESVLVKIIRFVCVVVQQS